MRMIVLLLWFLLVLKHVLGELLYYRLGAGEVFGPFPDQQLQEWASAGYFHGAEELLVSTSVIPESFVPYQIYYAHNVDRLDQSTDQQVQSSDRLTKRKYAGIWKTISKQAGSIVKLNKRKLIDMKKSMLSSTGRGAVVSREVDASERQNREAIPHVEAAPTEAASSLELDWPVPDEAIANVGSATVSREEEIAATEELHVPDNDDQLLKMIKRNKIEIDAEDKLATTPRKSSQKDQVRTFSVRSLPKVDHSLWDTEQEGGGKSTLSDDFLAELQLKTAEVFSSPERSKIFAAPVSVQRRVCKQVSVILLEIGRFLLSLLRVLIPGPVQSSWQYLTSLAGNASDRPVLLLLLGLAVASVLRILLYVAAVPSLFELIIALSESAKPEPAAKFSTNDAAAAGHIVTTVLHQSTARPAAPLVNTPPVQEILSNARIYLQHMLDHFSLEHVSRAAQLMLAIISPGSIRTGALQIMTTMRAAVAQLRTAHPAMVSLSLIISSIVLIDAIIVSSLQASVSQRYIADPVYRAPVAETPDSEVDDEDELLDADKKVHMKLALPQPAWSQLSADILKLRVPAAPYVTYIQHMCGHAAQLTMFIWLVLQLWPQALSWRRDAGQSEVQNLLFPLGLLAVGGIVEFYLTPAIPTDAQAIRQMKPISSVSDRRIARVAYLTTVLSDASTVDWCRKWHLLDYLTRSLSQETAQLGEKLLHERASAPVSLQPQAGGSRAVSFSSTLSVTVLMLSLYGWLHGGSKLLETALRKEVDLASSAVNVATGLFSKYPIMRAAFVLPRQVIQVLTQLILQSEPPVEAPSFIVAQKRIPLALSNAMLVCVGVLVLPSALRLLQVTSLQRIHAQAGYIAAGAPSKSMLPDPQRTTAEALLNAQAALDRVPAIRDVALEQEQVSAGWTTDGPDVAAGIDMSGVSAVLYGRTVLKDLTLKFPAGQITVVLSPETGSSDAASALLQLICAEPTAAAHAQTAMGTTLVHGRDLKEWNAAALRRRTTFLTVDEPNLQLQAGALAGCLPGTAGVRLKQALRAQVASGAHSVISALSAGPASVVSEHRSGDTVSGGGGTCALSAEQWRALHVSRALCNLDAPIVLLDQPTAHMSETQEALFFAFLREHLRPDQVMVVTSHHTRTASYADCAVQLSAEGRVEEAAENVQHKLAASGGAEPGAGEASSPLLSRLSILGTNRISHRMKLSQ